MNHGSWQASCLGVPSPGPAQKSPHAGRVGSFWKLPNPFSLRYSLGMAYFAGRLAQVPEERSSPFCLPPRLLRMRSQGLADAPNVIGHLLPTVRLVGPRPHLGRVILAGKLWLVIHSAKGTGSRPFHCSRWLSCRVVWRHCVRPLGHMTFILWDFKHVGLTWRPVCRVSHNSRSLSPSAP